MFVSLRTVLQIYNLKKKKCLDKNVKKNVNGNTVDFF